MRLNLGSGPHPAPEPWLNLDCRRIDGANVVSDVAALPFVDGCAGAIYAGHVIEHLPLAAVAAFLGEVRRVLAPLGTLLMVGPDIDRCVELGYPHDHMATVIRYGTPPKCHAWTCSATVLAWLLASNGWQAEEVPIEKVSTADWPIPSHAPWQCAFLCR